MPPPPPRLVLRTVAGGATPPMSAFLTTSVAFAVVICHNKRLDGNPETWKIFGKFQPSVLGKPLWSNGSPPEGDLPEAACLGTASSSSLSLLVDKDSRSQR